MTKGQRIRKRREELNIKQTELAEAATTKQNSDDQEREDPFSTHKSVITHIRSPFIE